MTTNNAGTAEKRTGTDMMEAIVQDKYGTVEA